MLTDHHREQIALFRYKLISPILAEPRRKQNEYLRAMARKKHDVPYHGERKYTIPTLKNWLRKYRRHGFDALKPKKRVDKGRPRRLNSEVWDMVKTFCQDHPYETLTKLHASLVQQNLLGDPPIAYNTFVRQMKIDNVLPSLKRTDVRKRYEAPTINYLWVADFMHGPQVIDGNRSKKAILYAIIDDYSRVIVGYAFNVHETVAVITEVSKEAFLTYGLPHRFYCDNGASFSSDLLTKACAQAGISLIHSKPYDSASRGKIERFFRTVRQKFLNGLQGKMTLEELNQTFSCWLHHEYHHHFHCGIGQTPMERYYAATGHDRIRRLSAAELDTLFLIRHERTVNNDATLSFKGRIYEVPAAYIRQRVELRHPVDDDNDLCLYDNGERIAKLNLVDVKENGRHFRPTVVADAVSFSDQDVK